MPLLIPNPSFIIHESCYVYIILHYIHVCHHNIHTQPNRSSRNKQTSKHNTISPNTSLRLRGLAQASPPPPRRGLKQEQESSAGSRLGETPLAWTSCLLAQKHTLVAWATTRAESSGRPSARLAWASLSVSVTVRT